MNGVNAGTDLNKCVLLIDQGDSKDHAVNATRYEIRLGYDQHYHGFIYYTDHASNSNLGNGAILVSQMTAIFTFFWLLTLLNFHLYTKFQVYTRLRRVIGLFHFARKEILQICPKSNKSFSRESRLKIVWIMSNCDKDSSQKIYFERFENI